MGMKSEEEAVALQAIEFWTTVAEDEAQLEQDYQDAQDVCLIVIQNHGFAC